MSRALREEERRAWQRLIRVMGHELNNSLAPIKSIAGSLSARLPGTTLAAEERMDFERGLGVIEARAASLNRFLQGYRQLAQMPPPVLRKSALSPLVTRVAGLETRIAVAAIPGPDVSVMADPDQLEQMLINLVRNAAEAVLEGQPVTRTDSEATNGSKAGVVISWTLLENIRGADDRRQRSRPSESKQYFCSFLHDQAVRQRYRSGTSRQIAEAHGGSLELTNRADERGCRVKVVLPRAPS